MRFAWLGAGAALSLVIAAGCSTNTSPSDRTGRTRQAIQGGSVDSVDKYAVGLKMNNGSNCSGALIAPNLVVTARHCIQSIDYKNPDVPGTIDCTKNPTFTGAQRGVSVTTATDIDDGPYVAAKKIIVPQNTSVCGNDIALLILASQITTVQPITPGVQYPINYSKYLTSFTAIGYGATYADAQNQPCPYATQAECQSGIRRKLELIRIACIPGDQFMPCPPEFSETEFVAGDGTCSGDSGSSAFEQGSYKLGSSPRPVSFGVLSRGGQDKSTCIGSIYTRLDKFRDLVISAVEEASKSTPTSASWTLYGKPTPDWTIFVPPEEKDAGTAQPDAGPTTKPTGLGFGEACASDPECGSKICADGYCTDACTTSDTCPEGYECREDLCLVAAPAPAAPTEGTTTTTTESCSTSGGPVPWGSLLLAGAVSIGLAGRRRRRS